MAPTAIKKLTSLQEARRQEIETIRSRLTGKPRDSLNVGIMESRIGEIKSIWAEARATHSDIIVRDEAESDPYIIQGVFGQLRACYEDALDEVLSLLQQLQIADEPALRPVPNVTPYEAGAGVSVARLPKISLPTFSGKYEDWNSFCDLFTTLVHEAPRVSDATKFQYLKLCLKGSAADLIKDVMTTDANYLSTWQALKARYHNPRLIINKHLASLLSMPYLKRESAVELRSFSDEAQRLVRALENLKMPVTHWDAWLIFILSERLDSESRKAWELELSERDRQVLLESDAEGAASEISVSYPKFGILVEFLEKRSRMLTMIAPRRAAEKRSAPPPTSGPPARKVFHAEGSRKIKCFSCSGPHILLNCPQFKQKTLNARRSDVKRFRLCFNCLGQHMAVTCPSSRRCAICQGKHHSLLHSQDRVPLHAVQRESKGSGPSAGSPRVLHASLPLTLRRNTLLATARVQVVGPRGKSTYVRALLDQGSEVSIITERIVQLLELPKQRVQVPLSGLAASSAGTANSMTEIKLRSLVNMKFQIEAAVLILPQLTSRLPSCDISDHIDLDHFSGLTLADSRFWKPEKIDLLLGADLYGRLLLSGVKRLGNSELVAQETRLGWIVSGPLQTDPQRRAGAPVIDTPMSVFHCGLDRELDESLQQFWNLEEVPKKSMLKPEDEECERLFRETHGRDSHGRYEVKLPLRSELPAVAVETRRMAIASLSSMHRRFAKDSFLSQSYCEFMAIYEKLGHMSRVPPSELRRSDAWYVPHHAVVSDTAAGRKLRVVFDASRRTRDGYFLNDFLFTGPSLQSDLSLILLNWRRYRFAFTADIVKMFRQIKVRPEDQDFQRIVWAPSAELGPVDYRLNTVTYGTACAPYLAIRTLTQLIEDEGERFPLGAQCLRSETYVDDTFAGADDLSTAIQKRDQLIKILAAAGVELDKWAASHSELLPATVQQISTKQIDADHSIKTLGVHWSPSQDEFRFEVASSESLSLAYTKRSILSNISRLFDPLGWLAPITVSAKILMQDMWILKCDWDSPLPSQLLERWRSYCNSLAALPSLSIERWLGLTVDRPCQIHGFSDASSRAYAAVVYLRIDEGNERFRVSLLSAKSRVAPVKTVSIPNLELCGAALLVKLISHLTKLDLLQNLPIFAWTDSQIVLTWLRKHPCHWKTFVANRVSLIQTELPSATWAHVPTRENPADLATRGVQPSDLGLGSLWWRGPAWLSMPSGDWPRLTTPVKALIARPGTAEPEILTRFSTLIGLVRFVAFCRRPLNRLRSERRIVTPYTPQFLSTDELADARVTVIRLVQSDAFAFEIRLLNSGKELPKRNWLRKLNPFIDVNDDLLRVGGRLADSNLVYAHKHPPILPHHSALSVLFVRQAHHQCLHGGPTLTSSILMQQVWILGRNRLVKNLIRKCVACQRVKPHSVQQLMGNLPAARVTRGRAFSTCGLDYAGPLQVRMSKGRGKRASKGYVALFVCFATRAIHLELVSDLTTTAFIGAYRRMVGRRGLCKSLYSDNATNFRGADRELQSMFTRASTFYDRVAPLLANDGTCWTFIPANSPHYGGLWEAGVKSVKHHLKRVVGEHTLTFEELSTVLVEIEACLNSRPLGALSSDPDDLQALTPSHFLNEGVSSLLPEAEFPDLPENRLTRFQLLQRIRNGFWKRWSTEYVLRLQEREKWRDPSENFAIGRLVLVKDDRYPPAKWPLGRVCEVHPGPDGLVRVVTVKTVGGSLRRHVARLCPLILGT